MFVLHQIPSRPVRWRRPVVAIGIFDGVHRGHQTILRRAAARAAALGATPAAITFYPHPLAVLAPGKLPPLLLSLEQRLRSFSECGIRSCLVIPFTRSFSRWKPDRFVRQLLVERLRVREVVVGHDFGFGAGRAGDVETLKALGRRWGFRVRIVGPVVRGGGRISSHRIREMIRAGRLSVAARRLGKPPTVVGRVVRGSGRGRRIGFPTANLRLEAGLLPPVGVYAVSVRVGPGSRPRGGMANVGLRPTFTRSPARSPLLEVHLFGFRGSLYGRRLEVGFLRRLRPERRFASATALARQLRKDAARALP